MPKASQVYKTPVLWSKVNLASGANECSPGLVVSWPLGKQKREEIWGLLVVLSIWSTILF